MLVVGVFPSSHGSGHFSHGRLLLYTSFTQYIISLYPIMSIQWNSNIANALHFTTKIIIIQELESVTMRQCGKELCTSYQHTNK